MKNCIFAPTINVGKKQNANTWQPYKTVCRCVQKYY